MYLDQPPVILTALPDRRWRVYLRPSSPDSDLLEDALRTITRYLPAATFADVENPTRFHCHTKVADRYRTGRVLVAGDAAHVCSPAQGHGMNSGLQDAFNLGWKLALVCRGEAAPSLLDSYEAERRPVAETITASGDATENAHLLTDPGERRSRDADLRAVFADPTSRHHEAVAEAELDIDYRSSPIVTGDAHHGLAPGQRLPDTVRVASAHGESTTLYELCHHAGHTVVVLAGPDVDATTLTTLEAAIEHRVDPRVVEARVYLGPPSVGGRNWGTLDRDARRALGVEKTCVLAVRPDGHVGLRADHDHAEALAAYQRLLSAGGP